MKKGVWFFLVAIFLSSNVVHVKAQSSASNNGFDQTINLNLRDLVDNEKLRLLRKSDPELKANEWLKLSADLRKTLDLSTEQEWIVLLKRPYNIYKAAEVKFEASSNAPLGESEKRKLRDVARLQQRQLVKTATERVLNRLEASEWELVTRYKYLSMIKVKTKKIRQLSRLLGSPDVALVTRERVYKPTLTQSLPLIDQLEAQTAGIGGQGVAQVIIDSGLDYTNSAFGCSAIATPATCPVVASVDVAMEDGVLDDMGHGTQVAGVAAAVAPESNLIGIDVFHDGNALSSDIGKAIDWIIDNRDLYNIVVANFSLGSDQVFGLSNCDILAGDLAGSFRDLVDYGVLPVVSSGNNAQATGISAPACLSSAFSVGASYDQAFANISYPSCSESNVNVDDITCFTNSWSSLDMLAPGSLITTTGSSVAGTSFASPHVAGAAALLIAQTPALSIAQVRQKLTASTTIIEDSRNSFSFPRLELAQVLQPANDDFAFSQSVAPLQTVSGNSVFSSAQANEPGGFNVSVWYSFNVPTSSDYQVHFNSNIAQVLTVFEGGTLAGLNVLQIFNSNDIGNINLQTGVNYKIQVASVLNGGEFDFNFVQVSPSYVDEEIPFLPAWAIAALIAFFSWLLQSRRIKN